MNLRMQVSGIIFFLIGYWINNYVYLLKHKPLIEGVQIETELLGSFIVTFLGIYLSFLFSKSNDLEKEKIKEKNYLKSSLALIYEELDINIDTIKFIIEGINTMPKIINQYYDQYGLLQEFAANIKSIAFYSTFSTPSIHEIIKNQDLFNDIQVAYVNMNLTINGLSSSRNVFYDYKTRPLLSLEDKKFADIILTKEQNKLKSSLKLLEKAKQDCTIALDSLGLKFTKQ